ncbi:MAG: acyl carrier protein [Clostridia bacterium]|nr:acyl carrier protein [Clostridia bacterium]
MEFEKIVKIISEQLGVDEASITKETAFVDDLGADSLDVVELIMAMEEEFDMEIADGEADSIKTVGDVLDYIKAHA